MQQLYLYRTVLGLGVFTALLSTLGLIVPPGYTTFTALLPSGGDAFIALFAGCALMVMACSAYFYSPKVRLTAIGIGGILISVALLGLFYPVDLGSIGSYARPANVMVLLVAGLAYLLVTLELERTTAQLALLKAPAAQIRIKRTRLSELKLVDVVTHSRPRLSPLRQRLVSTTTILSNADSKMRAYSSRFVRTTYWQMLRQYYVQHFGRERVSPALRSS